MLKFFPRIVLSLVLFAIAFADAQAARRMALVIGIDDYQSIPRLQKAVGDARAMSSTLGDLGFQVTSVLNADRRAMNVAIGEFTSRLRRDDLVFVHFSGHGVEIDGENYLLPADVPKPKSGQPFTIKYEGIGLRRLIDDISRTGARTRIFVVDACRDNPFEQAGVRSVGATRGLARVEAPAGTFILYSAGYRQTALDRLGPNDSAGTSVYTRVLTGQLSTPGRSIAEVARAVRTRVQELAASVGHVQRPAYYDELSDQLVLKTPLTSDSENNTTSPGNQAGQQIAIELAYWQSIRNSKDRLAVQSYIDRYPSGQFVVLAKRRLAALGNAVPANPPPQKTEPQKKSCGPGKQLNRFGYCEIMSAAASAGQDTLLPTPGASDRNFSLTIGVQRHLARLGCDPGATDGIWGGSSARALDRFRRYASVRLNGLEPTREVFEMLARRSGRICPLECQAGYIESGNRCIRNTCAAGKRLNRFGYCEIISSW